MALQEVGVRFVTDGKAGFLRDIRSGEDALRGFAGEAELTGGRVQGASRIMTGALLHLGAIAVDAFFQAGRAAVGFLTDSVSVAGNYEATLNRFAAVTGESLQDAGMDLSQFSDLFLQLGQDTQYSAGQAADAAVNLAKGGIDPATIAAGGLAAAMDLAAAGELDLAEAAEIAAKQLGVWVDTAAPAAEKAAFLAQTANLLAQAANASTVNVDDLALGLSNVGGVAKIAGLSFEETVQTMALLAPGFSSAADAGTSFKTFLSRLIPTTKSQTAAMIDLGLATEDGNSAFYDAEGNFIGMEAAADLLYQATKDLSEESRLAALNVIFGSDAVRAAALIAERGAPGFIAMGDAMRKAGTAADQARLRNQGWNFAMDQLKGSMETLKIVIGTALIPTLSTLVNDYITPGINGLTTFAKEVLGVGASSAVANSGLGSIGGAMGLFNEGVMTTSETVLTFQERLDLFVQDLATKIVEAVPVAIEGLGLLAEEMVAWVDTSLPGWLDALGQFGQRAGEWAIAALPGVLSSLGTLAQGLIDGVLTYLPRWGAALLQFGIQAVSWIGEQLPALGGALGQFFNTMVNWVVDSLPRWGEQLALLRDKAIQWIHDALPGLGENLGEYAGVVFNWIAQTIVDVVPKLLVLAGQFVSWIVTDVLPELPGTLAKIGEAILNFVVSFSRTVSPKIFELAMKFVDWVETDVLPDLPAKLAMIFDTVSTWVGNQLVAFANKAMELGQAIVQGVIDGITSMASAVGNAISGMLESAYQAGLDALGIRSPSKVTREGIGVPFAEGIAEGIQDGSSAVHGAVQALAATATSGIGDMMLDSGLHIGQGLSKGIEKSMPLATQAFSAMIDRIYQTGIQKLAIHSPSRITQDGIGIPFGEGIAIGISATENDVANAVNQLAGESTSGVGDMMYKSGIDIATLFGKGIDKGSGPGMKPLSDAYAEIERMQTDSHTAMLMQQRQFSDSMVALTADQRERMADIARKQIDDQRRAAQELNDTIRTGYADLIAEQESNDLDLVGFGGGSQALKDREASEAAYRAAMDAAYKEAQALAVSGEAALAQDVLRIRENQIEDQLALDEEYARRQKELANNPAALEALKVQYDEATAAIQAAADIRIELARRAAEQIRQDAEAERAAILAEAEKEAARIREQLAIAASITEKIIGKSGSGGSKGDMPGLPPPTDLPIPDIAFNPGAPIAPPASASQIANNFNYSTALTNNFNYQPIYQGSPRTPQQDFAIMRVLASA